MIACMLSVLKWSCSCICSRYKEIGGKTRVRAACTLHTRHRNGMARITHTHTHGQFHRAHTITIHIPCCLLHEASYRTVFYLYSRYACVQYVFSSVSESIVFYCTVIFPLFSNNKRNYSQFTLRNICLDLILFLGNRKKKFNKNHRKFCCWQRINRKFNSNLFAFRCAF